MMQAFTDDIVFDPSVRCLCTRPYPNHPKGCPNFGQRPTCPPQCLLFTEVYQMNRGFWVVWTELDFAVHCARMKKKHPHWTQRQVECCLYWQRRANKKLNEELQDVLYYLADRGNWWATSCPEAMGVNVTETMKRLGVILEWPPQKIVRKVAMIGVIKTAKNQTPKLPKGFAVIGGSQGKLLGVFKPNGGIVKGR